MLYNDSGTNYEDSPLREEHTYYYQAWSFANWTYNPTLDQWSDNNASANETPMFQLINCSTDESTYSSGETVTFTAWVNVSNGSTVALLIANSTSNLNSSNYTSRGNCIANSTNTSIESQPQQITATMTAASNTTGYAKLCNSSGGCICMNENTTTWNKTYDGEGAIPWDDIARSVANDSNDNIYVVGHGNSIAVPAVPTGDDWWIKKFWSNGTEDTSWNKTFDGGSLAAGSDIAYSVAVDSNDNVYVAGVGEDLLDLTSNQDWWIKKFSSDGTEDTTNWNITYSHQSDSYDYARSVAVDSDDNVYVVGYYATTAGDPVKGTNSIIKKFSSDLK